MRGRDHSDVGAEVLGFAHAFELAGIPSRVCAAGPSPEMGRGSCDDRASAYVELGGHAPPRALGFHRVAIRRWERTHQTLIFALVSSVVDFVARQSECVSGQPIGSDRHP